MIVLNNNNRKEKIFHPNTHVHTHTNIQHPCFHVFATALQL